ncbi:hypothetical protein P3T18_004044 [Paraburkholderia sp. GAS199]|uniref:hypothetical protein n=1 Tax=Paraburkholderia sp. GAS199 TaxID=3035126 RepID=UPI003D222190
MSHLDIDKELSHLERVFGQISANDRIPLSYWRNRLVMLPRDSLMPSQRARLARLDATLSALEHSSQKAVVD